MDQAERLAALGIARVAVFDDEQPDPAAAVTIEEDAWEGLLRILESDAERPLDPDRAQQLRDRDPSEWDDSLTELEADFPEQIADFRRTPRAIRDAGMWVDWLEAAGVTVDVFPSWAAFAAKANAGGNDTDSALSTYGLVLLDYQFGTPDEGEASKGIAKEIANRTRSLAKSGNQVPILARFSAEPVERTEEEILDFLDEVRFPRSAYAVVPKASIRAPEWEEPFLRELEKADAGRRLFALTVATGEMLVEAARQEAERLLFRLDAPSVRLLNERALEPEGVAGVEHWMDIIINLVSASLRASPEVARATGAMLDLMIASSKPGVPFNTPALSDIENRLRFDYVVNRLLRPIDFGDIFVFDAAPDRVALVVTQACDMAVRASGKSDGLDLPGIPERPRVTLILGTIREAGTSAEDSDDGWTTDFSLSPESTPNAAIEWKFDTPVMLPRAVLDLVSLREDGRAVLPADVTADTSFWTQSFRAYVADLVSSTNTRMRNSRGHLKGPIRFDGDDLAGRMPGLGLFAQYPRAARDGTNEPFLGVRRIARLRSIETQRIAHRMNFWAGRVALTTRLPQKRREVTLRLVSLHGDAAPEMAGEALFIKDDKQAVAIDVATARFRELCRLLPAFGPLDAEAARWGERFNLKAIVEGSEMTERFVLQPNGKDRFDLKEKQQGVQPNGAGQDPVARSTSTAVRRGRRGRVPATDAGQKAPRSVD